MSVLYGFAVAPPPPPPNASSAEYNKGKMNVKRINWEKLDHQKVENTIWEQVCFLFLFEGW